MASLKKIKVYDNSVACKLETNEMSRVCLVENKDIIEFINKENYADILLYDVVTPNFDAFKQFLLKKYSREYTNLEIFSILSKIEFKESDTNIEVKFQAKLAEDATLYLFEFNNDTKILEELDIPLNAYEGDIGSLKIYTVLAHSILNDTIIDYRKESFAYEVFLQKELEGLNLSKSKLKKKSTNDIFTNLYLCKDESGVVKFSFGIDLKALSAKSSLKNNMIDIENLSILRKRIDLWEQEEVFIANIANALDNHSENGSLKETNVTLDSDTFKFFTGSDVNVIDYNVGSFQYGVELTVRDNTRRFLEELIVKLESNINYLNQFLETAQLPIYFDSETQDFSEKFEQTFIRQSSKISNIVSEYISAKNLILDVNTETDIKKYLTLLSPKTADLESIQSFIHLYNALVSKIVSIKNSTFDNLEIIKYWFKEKYTPERDVIAGYSYLPENYDSILNTVTVEKLENFSKKQINSYASEENGIEDSRYGYFAPYIIYINGIKFNPLNEHIEEDYINLEMNILDYKDNKDIALSRVNKTQKDIFSEQSRKGNVFVSNLTKTKVKNDIEQDTHDLAKIDPSYILLAFYKKTKENILTKKKEIILTENVRTRTKEIPWQLIKFFDKKDKYFFNDKRNVFKDLRINSKFNILFNTIVKVEYLKNFDGKKEDWKLLTKAELENLKDSKYLCRLIVFQDKSLNINEFKRIELPIINKYFILDKKSKEDSIKRIDVKQKEFKEQTQDKIYDAIKYQFPKGVK